MEQVRRVVTPARVHRARAVRAGRLAGGLIAIGWAVTFVAGRGNWDVVISASAFWLVAVLFLLSAWELVMLLTGAAGIGVLPRGKWMGRLETWLVPAALVGGLLLGTTCGADPRPRIRITARVIVLGIVALGLLAGAGWVIFQAGAYNPDLPAACVSKRDPNPLFPIPLIVIGTVVAFLAGGVAARVRVRFGGSR